MPTAHESCSNCGAKLAAADAGAVLRCEYCGTENRIEDAPAPSPPLPVRASPPRRSTDGLSRPSREAAGNRGLVILGGLGAFALAVTIWVIVRRPVSGAVTPAELHTAAIVWNVDTPLDAPPPATSREHFDPLANIDWAAAIGKAWWPDARLLSIEANPIGKDGLIDLTKPDAEVEYEFDSAQCMADYQARIQTTSNVAKTTCHLVLELKKSSTMVTMALIGRDGFQTIEHPPCKISEVFARLERDHQLAARPTYAITLEGRTKLEWQLRAGFGSSPLEASTGLAYDFCVTP